MSSFLTPARPLLATGLVASSLLVLLLAGSGTASAASTDSSSPVASGSTHILGVQWGTATWLFLGVVLLTVGLLASTRSRHLPVAGSMTATPSAAGLQKWDSVADRNTSVSTVRT